MSDSSRPKISIGLPVYNGEDYIALSIAAVLKQTFEDFELIICDNASSDNTEKICREYTQIDPRVKYHRNSENIGAAANFNLSVELASGEYFKWMAHDDLIDETFLEKCLDGLEKNRNAIMAYPRAVDIDKDGNKIRPKNFDLRESSTDPTERFLHFTCIEHSCFAIFGLLKLELLKSTPMIGRYVASDRVLLVRLCLTGPFYEVPEELYFHREHPHRSTRVVKALQLMLGWFDPSKVNKKNFPYWRMFSEYFKAICQSGLSCKQKFICCWHMVRWTKRHFKDLTRDIMFFIRVSLFGLPKEESSK